MEVEEGAFPAKNRHYYPPPPTTGTRVALMERREAPYPYSKMCELCELCELFVKKLLSKTECAILPDGALLIVMKNVAIISV